MPDLFVTFKQICDVVPGDKLDAVDAGLCLYLAGFHMVPTYYEEARASLNGYGSRR